MFSILKTHSTPAAGRPTLRRRSFLIAQAGWLAAPALVWAQQGEAVRSLDDALRWLDWLERRPTPRATGAWPLRAVLEHLSQSIEMSQSGFPQPRSALFQKTLGAAAFAVFDWRGKMQHNLAEPIPGAPALSVEGPWQEGAQRLRRAISAFQAQRGPLQPHFAYGVLSQAEYARAHGLHIANHQDEVVA